MSAARPRRTPVVTWGTPGCGEGQRNIYRNLYRNTWRNLYRNS
ncbi:hypothetical protein ACFYR1_53270 [Streptomyces canus]